jgi:hypothetical protein
VSASVQTVAATTEQQTASLRGLVARVGADERHRADLEAAVSRFRDRAGHDETPEKTPLTLLKAPSSAATAALSASHRVHKETHTTMSHATSRGACRGARDGAAGDGGSGGGGAGRERQVVALHLAGEIYGIDIEHIHTVITPQAITQVPRRRRSSRA